MKGWRSNMDESDIDDRSRLKIEDIEEPSVPDGFLRIRDVIAALARGMYATFPQPKPVHAIKFDHQKASVIFGPWKEHAAQRLRAASCDGDLPIYAKGNSDPQPVMIPADVVGRLIPVRGGLPEHAIRPNLKTTGGDPRLLKVLSSGVLLVRQDDFGAWYKSERRKGRWSSQRLRKEAPEGRPSRVNNVLRDAVANALRERKRSPAELRRDLIASGSPDVPSVDTLERLIDRLYRETGRPEFFRNKRRRRSRV